MTLAAIHLQPQPQLQITQSSSIAPASFQHCSSIIPASFQHRSSIAPASLPLLGSQWWFAESSVSYLLRQQLRPCLTFWQIAWLCGTSSAAEVHRKNSCLSNGAPRHVLNLSSGRNLAEVHGVNFRLSKCSPWDIIIISKILCQKFPWNTMYNIVKYK